MQFKSLLTDDRVVGRFYRDKHFSLDESKRSVWLNTQYTHV
jgi:hypothetical protein